VIHLLRQPFSPHFGLYETSLELTQGGKMRVDAGFDRTFAKKGGTEGVDGRNLRTIELPAGVPQVRAFLLSQRPYEGNFKFSTET
jgi:hypothetical protein